jgi:hypothetical protein
MACRGASRGSLSWCSAARGLVLFNPASGSKLRGCDFVPLKVGDAAAGGHVQSRGGTCQKKPGRPVQFGIKQKHPPINLRPARGPRAGRGRLSLPEASPHLSTRHVPGQVASAGLNPATYGTDALRRTRAALMYRKSGNPGAVRAVARTHKA